MRRRLAPADYVTLAGAGIGWTAVLLFLSGRPDEATLALLLAFSCDKVDGYLARRGYGSPLGHHLDALADVVIYLVPTAVLLSETLAVAGPFGAVAGAVVLVFGVVRLARHAVDGTTTGREPYYSGLTAFHVAAWALVVRLAVTLSTVPALVGVIVIAAAAPLMVAPVRISVTRRQLAGAVAVGVLIAAGSLVELFAPA